MTVYQGSDVLDQTEPSRDGDRDFTFDRPFVLLDNEIGRRQSDADGPAPALQTPFIWIADGRTEIQALKDFLLARKGRAVPFWVPSYQRDMRPTINPADASAQLTIRRFAYTSQMFASTGARRHLAIYEHHGAAPIYRKVTGSEEAEDGLTETLSLDSNFTQDYDKDKVIVSFLVLCRMTNDKNSFEWLSRDVVRAELSFTEVPLEAPT